MELYLTSRTRLALPDNRVFEPEDMPLDTVLKVFDVAKTAGKPLVVRGNEPLLYPQLEQLFASAAKRQLPLLFETTGLMPTLARELVAKHCQSLVLRVYRPELYSPADLAERAETLAWLREKGVTIALCVVVDEIAADYAFALAPELCGQDTEMVLFRVPCRIPVQQMAPFVAWYVGQVEEQMRRGHQLVLDCGVKDCAFTDELLGRYTRLGQEGGQCVPHAGVRPDGRTVHCWEMAGLPSLAIENFKTADDITRHFFDEYSRLQMSADLFASCRGCVSRYRQHCTGVSMGAKEEALERRYQQLREEFAADDTGQKPLTGEERVGKLFALAQVSLILCRYADAAECLEEMRSLQPQEGQIHLFLGETYWALGRFAESEDEYRKASRLMPEPFTALQELYQRLKRHGHVIRARRLWGEIEKLKLSAQSEQK